MDESLLDFNTIETIDIDIEKSARTYYGDDEKMEMVITNTDTNTWTMTHGFIGISKEKKILKNNTAPKNMILAGIPTFAIPVENFRSKNGGRFVNFSKSEMKKCPELVTNMFRLATGSVIYSNEQFFGMANLCVGKNNASNFYLTGIPIFVIASVIMNDIEKIRSLDISDISSPDNASSEKAPLVEWDGTKYNAFRMPGNSCGHMPKIGKEMVFFCEDDMIIEVDGHKLDENCNIYVDKFKQYIPINIYCTLMCLINKNADKTKTFKVKYLKKIEKGYELKECNILPVAYDEIYNVRPFFNNVIVRIGDYVFIELSQDLIIYLETKGIYPSVCTTVNSTSTRYKQVIFGNLSKMNTKSIVKSINIFIEKDSFNIVKSIDNREIISLVDIYDIYKDCQKGLIKKSLVLRFEQNSRQLKKFIKI
jgi:hypothetical protein